MTGVEIAVKEVKQAKGLVLIFLKWWYSRLKVRRN